MSDKGYSTGGAKKWLIIIGGVVFVAVLVVIILMAIPPNTYNAVETLYRTANSSFLVSESERKEYVNYEKKITDLPELNYYSDEIADMRTLAQTVNQMLDFYSNQLVFADSNKNLKKNYKVIKNNLNKANEHKEKISDFITEVTETEENTAFTYFRSMVIEIREEFIAWLKANASAFVGLSNGCVGSLGKTVENNTAFKIITSTINDALNVVISEYDTVAESDMVGDIANDYDYKLSPKVDYFKFVVSTYIQYGHDINEYYFDKTISDKYELVAKFYDLYQEPNFENIISTVKGSGEAFTFEKTYENVIDEENVLDAVKAFLKGGK